jgi:hypothetical protein
MPPFSRGSFSSRCRQRRRRYPSRISIMERPLSHSAGPPAQEDGPENNRF